MYTCICVNTYIITSKCIYMYICFYKYRYIYISGSDSPRRQPTSPIMHTYIHVCICIYLGIYVCRVLDILGT